jgi:eukaryotic-like serine/threonine-protein kinase
MFEGALGSRRPQPSLETYYRFKIGDVISERYLVRGFLGQGGMGAVLRVHDRTRETEFALKYCEEIRFHQRFGREVRCMSRVKSNHVIEIVDSSIDNDPPYFVMPLAVGSLEEKLTEYKGDEAGILSIMDQICIGVHDLHTNGVFHRDLKPANILRLKGGKIVVSDLGLARFETRDTTVLTNAVQHLGTADYLAPEQKFVATTINADHRTDIFQLGKLLYSLYTAQSPALIDYSVLPPGIANIIRIATASHPNERYQTIEAFHRALGFYRDSTDPRKNTHEILGKLITRLEPRLAGSRPRAKELSQLLELLTHSCALTVDQTISCFHLVPLPWLPVLSQEFTTQLLPVMRAYVRAIQERVGAYEWAFADEVAERMSKVHDNTDHIETKVLALHALMTAADKLRRHAPQRTFCTYLAKIKTFDMAQPVAHMIETYGTRSILQFRSINPESYHFVIKEALALRGSPNRLTGG